MKLNLSEIKEITQGAARIEEDEKGVFFHRFTKEQSELYRNRCDEFYMKSLSSSGVRMHFRTDSETLGLKADVFKGSSRTYFSFELFVDGKKIDTLDNFSSMDLPLDYTKIEYPLGEFSKTFVLGKGEKEVCLYFPWSAGVVLKEFSLSDGAFFTPVKRNKKLLAFGDSITQGYDALCPSNKYITKLANLLNLQEFNKAIGGEVFFPELCAAKEDFFPDLITVAYGTNDWFKVSKEDFEKNCIGFFKNLAISYPGVKTYVITPIWRKDENEPIGFASFEEVGKFIEGVAKQYDNITLVNGYDFIIHDDAFYGDLRLHPNDKGFEQYFDSLVKELGI